MMKRTELVAFAAVLVLVSECSSGVAQESYDAKFNDVAMSR